MSTEPTTTTPTTQALALTEEMRLATRKAHAISDKLVNLKLVVALTNKTIYGQSLLLFYYVFAQIEQSMESQKNNEILKPLQEAFKPIVRADVIKKDLDYYLGDDWSKKFAPPPAVVAYVKRIQQVEKEDPILLLAYTYHMYMALLFGGQMIKKMVKRSFSIEGETGLETFEFGGKSKMALRGALKDALNGMTLDAEPKKRLLEESVRVFKMNNDVVRGIEGMFKQFALWILKWVIVAQLLYWTYVLFIHGKWTPDRYRSTEVLFRLVLPHSSNRPAATSKPGNLLAMEGEHQPPPYREEYPPAVDSYNRVPPGPAPPGNYGAPPHDAYPPRDPSFQEPEQRGRDWNDRRHNDNRDRGGYGGGGYGAPRGRSRSRSPPGGGGGFGRNGGGGGGYYQGPPPQSRGGGGGGGDYQYRQDDSATGGGVNRPERKAVQSIEPMDSYKVFMMRQDENSTPETYQQRYEEYKKKYTQRLLRAFFDDHKTEEWLQERYSPAIRFRVDQQKRTAKIAEAKQFVERITSGVATINMDERESELTGSDYENDLEDSKRILYVRRVPCACPVATLSEAIKKAGGNFQHIYLSDPVKKSTFDFDRSAYIIYESAEAAAEALPKIHNTFVQDGDLFTPVRLQVSQHRSRAPIKTPSYLSVPDRLANDYKQALTLASLLDKALFVKESDLQSAGIEALLEDPAVTSAYASDKQKLDVVVAYLRRVHHYIYYAAVQCIDMGDIMHAHPALFCRPPPTTKDLEEEKVRKESVGGADEAGEQKGGWAASLDEKVQAYIEELSPENVSAKLEKNKNLVDEIESREEAALESTYANYAEKAGDDGKHRCRLCTKLFKSMEFVKKHIRNKHPELVEDKVAEVGESYMWEQYREDPNRPLPPIETTNTLSNPTLGGRGGSSYQGRSGPGGARGGYGGGPPGNRGGGYSRDGPGYRGGYGGPPRDNRPRRGSFGDNRGGGGGGGDRRSPPRSYNRPPPDGDLPVDPRQVSRSYQDLDNLQDAKVELSFDALDSLPPPKKKTKV